MKHNTIKKVARKKIEGVVASFPEHMQQLIKDNIILSGGAITSMLMGDKPNDYDFYMRTYESAKIMAEYFARIAPEMKFKRGPGIQVKVITSEFTNIKKQVENRISFYIKSAGVVGEADTYEYFESCPEAAADDFVDQVLSKEINLKDNYKVLFMSDNAVSLSGKVQFVIRFYGEPDQIHDNYDFDHCKCYYDYSNNVLSTPPEALISILSKALIYSGSLYPVASLFRIRKFLERGWSITAGQMLKIVWQLQEVDLSDRNILRDQLLGVDAAYMTQLISLLQNAPEGTAVDAAYVAKIVDQIFD